MNNNLSIDKFFPTLNIIYIALFSGQLIYFLVGLLILQSSNTGSMTTDLTNIFLFVTPIIVLSSILASRFLYSKHIASFDKSLSLESKLLSYRTGNIVKLALLEGANIFNISVMIITASYFFAALFIVIISLFLINRPSKEKFILDFEISADDALKIIG